MANRFSQYVRTDYTPLPVDYYQQALLQNDQEVQQKVSTYGNAYAQAKSLTPYGKDAEAYYKETLSAIENDLADVNKMNLKLPEALMKVQSVISNPKHIAALKNILTDTEHIRLAQEAAKKYEAESGNKINTIELMQALHSVNGNPNEPGDAKRYKAGRFAGLDAIPKYIDLPKLIDERVGKLEADIKSGFKNAGDFITNTETKELSKEKLRQAAIAEISADPNMQAQLQRNMKFDYFSRNPDNPMAAMQQDALSYLPNSSYIRDRETQIQRINEFLSMDKNQLKSMFGDDAERQLRSLKETRGQLANSINDYRSSYLLENGNANGVKGDISSLINEKYITQLAATQDRKAFKQETGKTEANPFDLIKRKLDGQFALAAQNQKYRLQAIQAALTPTEPGSNTYSMSQGAEVENNQLKPEVDKAIKDNSFLKDYLPNGKLPADFKLDKGNSVVKDLGVRKFDPEFSFGSGDHLKGALRLPFIEGEHHKAVNINGKVYPVTDISGQRFVIRYKGKNEVDPKLSSELNNILKNINLSTVTFKRTSDNYSADASNAVRKAQAKAINDFKTRTGYSDRDFIPINKIISETESVNKSKIDFNTSPQIVKTATQYGWSPDFKNTKGQPVTPIEYLAEDYKRKAIYKTNYYNKDFDYSEPLKIAASNPDLVTVTDDKGEIPNASTKANILRALKLTTEQDKIKQKAGLSTVYPVTTIMDINGSNGTTQTLGLRYLDESTGKTYNVEIPGELKRGSESLVALHQFSREGKADKTLNIISPKGFTTTVAHVPQSHSTGPIAFDDVDNPQIQGRVQNAVQSVANALSNGKPKEEDYKRAVELINRDAAKRLRPGDDRHRGGVFMTDASGKTLIGKDDKPIPIPGYPNTGDSFYITEYKDSKDFRGTTLNPVQTQKGIIGGTRFINDVANDIANKYFQNHLQTVPKKFIPPALFGGADENYNLDNE